MATAVALAPTPILQFFNNAGAPNVGGSVLTQVGGVNYPTYQDPNGTIALPNPIPLNSRGEVSNASGVSCELFLQSGVTYTFTLYDANGNQLNQASFVSSRSNSTYVNVEVGFGAVADGVTDDTAAFTSALASLGSLGGTVFYSKRHYIAGPLTVPANCTIKGPMSYVGAPDETVSGVEFGSMAALILSTANPIYLNEGAGIDGALIVPSGMTFPQANATSWTGTAVQSRGDNIYVSNSMILGFNQAINFSFQSSFTGTISGTTLTVSGVGAVPISVGQQLAGAGVLSGTIIISGAGTTWTVSVSQSVGPVAMTGNLSSEAKFFNNKIDCVNGIYIQDPVNIAYVEDNVLYPYATIGTVSKPSNWADRLGYGIYGQATYQGGGAVVNCRNNLVLGYLYCIAFSGLYGAYVEGCWIDGTNALANSYGIQILGGTIGGAGCRVENSTVAAVQTGIYIVENAGACSFINNTLINACEVSHVSGTNKAVHVQTGDLVMTGCAVLGTGPSGYTNMMVYINSANSRVTIDNCRSNGLNGSYAPIYNVASSPYVFLGKNDFGDLAAGSSPVFQSTLQTIASAAVLNLPTTINNNTGPETYLVSGTTTFGQIAGGYLGRQISLVFQGSLSISTGGGSPNGLVLLGGVTQNVSAGSILNFVYTSAGVWQQLPSQNPWYTPAGSSTTVAAGSTTNVFTNTTFAGSVGSTAYTITDLVSALKTLGIIKP